MKFFAITFAVLSICALGSEGIIRKCFPVVPTAPTIEPPTPAPTPAPTDAPTTPTPAPTDAPTTPTPAPTPAPTDAPTTPTPAPTQAPQANECAVWARYNGDSAPVTNGYLAGNSVINGSPVYVGFGMFGAIRLPARIQTSTVGAKTPGGYVPWVVDQKITYPEYLVLPQNCSCSFQPINTALTQRGLILTGDPLYKFAIGRKTVGTQVALSRVITNPTLIALYLKQYWIDASNIERFDDATELLVCSSPNSPLSVPQITFPTQACGVWSTVGMENAVTINGFSAGTGRNGITAWVGRGQQDGYFMVGRYQNEAPTGTYTSYGGDIIADYGSEWLIVPQGCHCTWYAPDAAKIRPGLVTAPDAIYNFGVGRHNFSTGLVSVARIHFYDTYSYYLSMLGTDYPEWATEMLVCETTPPPPNQCAVWARYNGDNAPATNGFSAGTSWFTNAPAYVGFGKIGALRLPARVQTSAATYLAVNKPAGVYAQVGGDILVTYGEYLVVPNGCECKWLPPVNASTEPGLVLTGDPYYKYAVGRKVVGTQVGIARVITETTLGVLYMQSYYTDNLGIERYEPASELLVCSTTGSTAGAPQITFPNEACGVWSSINMINSAASNGFAAGQTFNNITAYVGRGQQGGLFQPGRYQYEAPVGTYTPLVGDSLVQYGSEWLIVPQGCTCRWMSPHEAWIRRGQVTAPDNAQNYAVGRVNLTTGESVISYVHNLYFTDFLETYPATPTTIAARYNKEQLVCDTLPEPSQNPCDLWIKYYADTAPTVNGFNAGNSAFSSASNSTVYIARANYGAWLLPGRVQITGTTGTVYVSIVNEYATTVLYNNYGEYLVVRNGCNCAFQEPQVASDKPGLVRTGEETYHYLTTPYDFAITKITNGAGQISIGKTTTPFYQTQYTNPTAFTEVIVRPAPNVLVCDSNQDMSVKPTLNFGTNKACGLWSRYKPDVNGNWPASHGFLAGIDRNGNNAYVGRGTYGAIQYIGRVQTTGTAGVYISFVAGEPIAVNPEYLVVANNCNCNWTPYATAITKVGIVRSIDYTYHWAIGLKTFTSGKVALTSVNLVNGLQYYNTEAGLLAIDTATQLLVCETP